MRKTNSMGGKPAMEFFSLGAPTPWHDLQHTTNPEHLALLHARRVYIFWLALAWQNMVARRFGEGQNALFHMKNVPQGGMGVG
jgi:hypothetical protein